MTNYVLRERVAPHSGVGKPLVPHKGFRAWSLDERLFYILCVFSFLNLGDVATVLFEPRVPVTPVVFGAFAVLIFLSSRPRLRIPLYFFAAWTFFCAYLFFGFVGPETKHSSYTIAQSTGKLWISIIGFPMLAFRTVRREHLIFYFQSILVFGGLAAVLTVVQYFFMDAAIFEKLIPKIAARPTGVWMNANNCAMVLIFVALFAIALPARSRTKLFFPILALVAGGIILTFSRTGVLIFVMTCGVYAMMLKRGSIYLNMAIGSCLLLLLTWYFFDEFSLNQQERLQSVVGLLSGERSFMDTGLRAYLWGETLKQISSEWVFGLGHGSMYRIVPYGPGLNPHNSFISILGTSGIFGLITFVTWLLVVGRIVLGCSDIRTRAALFGAYLCMVGFCCVGDSMFHYTYVGAVLSLILVTALYDRARVQ